MNKSTEIKDEESCVEKGTGNLKIRAKEYEIDLTQVVSRPTPNSKMKPQMIEWNFKGIAMQLPF